MVFLAVESLAEHALDVGAQLHQPLVAAEVGRRLARRTERVALDLLPGHGRRHDHVVLQHAFRFVLGDGAELERRIEIRSRGAQQAVLERDQLAVERLVRLHLRLRVQPPALHVHAVECEQGASHRNAPLHHRVELQLVARAPLVGGQRPRGRLEREVVVAAGAGIAQRQHERALFSRVADQSRRLHVRRRLLHALGFAGQSDLHRALRQRRDVVGGDQSLQVADARLVVRKDRAALELMLFELADHVAVVGGVETFRPGHERRQRLHLVLDLAERDAAAALELVDRHVDADRAEPERVQLRGLAEIAARAREHLGADEYRILVELLLQRVDGLLPSVELEGREQLLDAAERRLLVREVALHLGLDRSDQLRIRQPLPDPVLRELRNRLVALLEPGVAVEPPERRPAPLRRHLRVQQRAQPLEHRARHIDVRQLELLPQPLALDLLPRAGDQDVEILQHRGVLLGRPALL